MGMKRHTGYWSYSTNVYIQNHWSRAPKLLGKTARTQILLFPETQRTLYDYIYLEDNTAYMVPSNDCTMGHKIKTGKHPRHGTQCVIQYPTKRNPAQSLQENARTLLGLRLYNSWQNIRETSKVFQTWARAWARKFKLELNKFLELLMSPKYPIMLTQQEATASSTS